MLQVQVERGLSDHLAGLEPEGVEAASFGEQQDAVVVDRPQDDRGAAHDHRQQPLVVWSVKRGSSVSLCPSAAPLPKPFGVWLSI
jgi:hypothetical protein